MPQQEMAFSDYLRVIVKHKLTVLGTAIAVTLATYAWASRQQPRFDSRARIKIQRVQTFADLFDEVLVSSGDPLENYIHEVRSSRVIARAAEALASSDVPVSAARLTGAVTTRRIERTDLIDVVVQGPTAEAAREWCAAVVRAFIEDHDEVITANARTEHRDIGQSLTNALANLAALDAEFGKLVGSAEGAVGKYDQGKVLAERLMDAKLKLQALLDEGNYTEEYPPIIALRKTIKDITAHLQSISSAELKTQSMMRDYDQKKKILEDVVSYLTRRREESRIALTKKSERVIEVEHASNGVPVTTAKAYLTGVGGLLGLMLGIVLAFVAENLDTSIRTLVEIEEIFRLPILGIIPHFSPYGDDVPIRPEGLLSRMRYSQLVHSTTIFWRAVRSSFTGRRRRLRSSGSTTLIVPFSPRSPATEGYRAIRTNLQLSVDDGEVGTVLVTSPGPSEGKSTSIANLAFAFAQAGKRTLLVGANMRRPTLYRTLGLERTNGLSEILVGEIAWREAIRDNRDLALGEKADDNLATASGTENLFLITCGGRTIQPAEWLSLPLFKAAVKEWEAEFDVVLIDAPPVLPVPDSVIMSATVRHVVLVYQAGATQRDSMLRAISLIQNAGTSIAGLVFNDLRATWSASPDYFHYRGYYGKPSGK